MFTDPVQEALKKHPGELQPHRGNWDGEPTKVNRPTTKDYTILLVTKEPTMTAKTFGST